MNQFAIAYGERFTRPAAEYAAWARLNRRALNGASKIFRQAPGLAHCLSKFSGQSSLKWR